MRCACIDIGSNTTRLLVAEPDGDGLTEVAAQRSFTRIGGGLTADGSISTEKVEEVAAVAAAQARLARELGAVRISAVATAAVRDAPNRDVLIDAVRAAAGVDVVPLSPQREAQLAFTGAARCQRGNPTEQLAVADVGGGSTELAVGSVARGVLWWRSLPLGSGALADRYLVRDPPAPSELEALDRHVERALSGLDPRPAARALAVGGSASSLRLLVGERLDAASLERALALVTAAPAAEVAARLSLHAGRVRLLPAGIMLLGRLGQAIGIELECAWGGLREGIVYEQLRRGS